MNVIVSNNVDNKVIGLITALSIVQGVNITLWSKKNKPVFDMFAEEKPDYLIITRDDVTKDIILAINEYKPKVIIYGVEAPLAIKNHVELVLVGDNIPKIITDNIDHNKLILHKAADIFTYKAGSFDRLFEADLGHVSLSTHPKSEQMIGLVCNYLHNHRLKVLGDVKYPTPAYLGVISNNQIMSFLSSVKIYLDNDTNFLLECAMNKTFVLSNVANPLFPHYNNPAEFLNLIDDFKDNEKARRNITKKAYKFVSTEHTYLDRVIDLGRALNEEQWIKEATEKKLALV